MYMNWNCKFCAIVKTVWVENIFVWISLLVFLEKQLNCAVKSIFVTICKFSCWTILYFIQNIYQKSLISLKALTQLIQKNPWYTPEHIKIHYSFSNKLKIEFFPSNPINLRIKYIFNFQFLFHRSHSPFRTIFHSTV